MKRPLKKKQKPFYQHDIVFLVQDQTALVPLVVSSSHFLIPRVAMILLQQIAQPE
jgi:sorbitol-specific phosphotransferase system component IIC